MMKRKMVCLLAALTLLLGGCGGGGTPARPAVTNSDAALLRGSWEQFISVESMPQSLTFSAGGGATVEGNQGKWKLEGNTLVVRQGSEERRYSYTISDYMMTLYEEKSETSSFYINPGAFTSGANNNDKLAGQWAAFSTFSMMLFDGHGLLDDINYNTAGRTVLQSRYTARDGILMTVDSSSNYTFNLYNFSNDGALLLAESSEYDSDNKQWTSYTKLGTPTPSLLSDWKRVVCLTGEGDTNQMPSALRLKSGGMGGFTDDGGKLDSVQWEYYQEGFLVLRLSDSDVRYAYTDLNGSVLYLNNDENQAWYIDASRFRPQTTGLKPFAGKWKTEDDTVEIQVEASGKIQIKSGGKTTELAGSAADGIWKLELGKQAYYMAASIDGDALTVNYAGLPFLADAEMPITLTKE